MRVKEREYGVFPLINIIQVILMKIATLLFTYNRSWYAEQVLTALSESYMLPEKLFIFQDGLKKDEDSGEWKKVNDLIKGVDWCDTEIIVSRYNKGLATSIVTGISYAFEKYDAVVVLEDDCIPAVGFLSFMKQCFEKYAENKRIYSVTGYSFPAELEEGEYDIYGCGRVSSWGWGTWKDRWEQYEKDYELVKKMKQQKHTSKNLAIWGSDLEETVVGNVRGTCDSWAVFWALKVIEKEGICISPYKSLIKNIGFDGSGVHCGSDKMWEIKSMEYEKALFHIPEEVVISSETIKAYIPLFGHYTAINQDDGTKERILVYGAGNFYRRNEKEICEKYFIQAYIDQSKKGWLDGKKIIKTREIEGYAYDWILIMIQDAEESMKVVKQLMAQKVEFNRILIGRDLYDNFRYGKMLTTR